MGKVKDAFTPWGQVRDYEDERLYQRIDWEHVREVEEQVIQEHVGFISLLDINSMLRHNEHWNVKFGDGMSLEQAIQCVQSGSAVVLSHVNGRLLLVDFENDWFETREC